MVRHLSELPAFSGPKNKELLQTSVYLAVLRQDFGKPAYKTGHFASCRGMFHISSRAPILQSCQSS
jgi:hypothetical protein